MFSSRAPQRLLLMLLVAQLSGCAPGSLHPIPHRITLPSGTFEVSRYNFLSRGGFVEVAPVSVRRTSLPGLGPPDRALARAALSRYCAVYRYETGPPDTAYWTTDGTWHFVQGCLRPV
jgi:hypothetical protein